jgi:hypothetical protein
MEQTRHPADLGKEPEHVGISRETLFRLGKSEDPRVAGRRSTRLPMAIPITVSGIDARGGTFKENTFTLSINRHGAEIATNRQLALGGEILVQNMSLGRTVKAKVVRVHGKRSPRTPFEVCVELREAENIWGVRFPPEDWEASLLAPETDQEPGEPPVPMRGRSAPATPPAPTPSLKLRGALAQLARGPASAIRPEAATEALAAAGATSDQQAAEGDVVLREPLSGVEEKVNVVRSLQQQLDEMAARLKTSQAELEVLLSTVYLMRMDWQAGVDQGQRQIREASAEAVQSASEKTRETWLKEFESASVALREQAQMHLEEAEAIFGSLEGAAGQAGAQGHAVQAVEDVGAKDALERFEARMDAQVESSAQQLQRCAEDTLEMLQEEFGAASRKLVAETQGKLADVTAQTLASLTRESEAAAEQYRGRLQEMLQEFEDANTRRIEACLQATLETQREALGAEIEEKMQGLSQQAVAGVSDKAAQVVKEATNMMYQQIGMVTVLMKDCGDQARAQIGPYFRKSAEDFQKQVAGLSRAALERHRLEMEALTESLHCRLQQAARAVGTNGVPAVG